MAKSNLTSGERLRVYHLSYRLNRSFHFIVCRLSQAHELGIWKHRDIREMLGLTQEIQMEINTLFLDRFSSIEVDDHAQFGKVRIAVEKTAPELVKPCRGFTRMIADRACERGWTWASIPASLHAWRPA